MKKRSILVCSITNLTSLSKSQHSTTMQLKTSILKNSKHEHVTILLIVITTLCLQIRLSESQQAYLNNDHLDCGNTDNATKGFVCNGISSSCTSYITFRSNPPYNSPPTIAYLLNSTSSAIARFNNISDVNQIEAGRLIVIPVTCSCTKHGRSGEGYYQHNANYTLQKTGETYYTIATDTYPGLTTCQAMMAQNPYAATNLAVGETFLVPLRCACPTSEQKKTYGAKFLLSYSVVSGDTVSSIAAMFGATDQSILDANELQPNQVIQPLNPILVPLKSEPNNLKLASSTPAPAPQSNSTVGFGSGGSSKTGVYIGVGVAAGVLVLSVVSVLAWFFLIRPLEKKGVSTIKSEEKGNLKGPESVLYKSLPGSYGNSQTTKSSSADLDGFKNTIGSLTAYKFREIEKATGNFSDGHRIKGSVYRGEFNGDEAAVKILKGNVPNDEINILKRINHYNIIRLSGYCIHEGNTYLVYEYAEKGSIDDWLFRQKKHHSEDDSQAPSVLSWKQRVQIACNVADALNYLHSYINPPYIHKNLKSSNILLDATNRTKITNFGLARTIQNEDESGVIHLTKHVVGTHGYLAPEYIENGAVTPKLDVFAFGVVILELLSGKPAVKPSGTNHGGADDLLFVVIRRVFEGSNVREKLTEFMDSNLHKEYPLDMAYSMAQLAHKCVDRDMNSRPSMAEVSMTLSKIYSSSLDWDPSDELTNTSSRSHITSI
ncbi:protein LYK5-like [Silene latifolia]|uniref:protein LYK5-like n=1 Tax=Silene latifolia TaxID=37657 RepID=UPI003D77AD74